MHIVSDIDECAVGKCHSNATCLNQYGSYSCECKAGKNHNIGSTTNARLVNCGIPRSLCTWKHNT